jgi:general secretion pathway protein K
MRRRLRQTARSSECGFVIIAVLWILAALAALTMIFSVYLSNSARALGATDISLERDALVSASLELTAYRLLSADEKSRPSQGSFNFRMDTAEALVTFTSEAARVDLNQAPKEMLAGLFKVIGAEQTAAGELAERVVGWRTKSKPNDTNDETALYLATGLTYSPRQAPFAHVNELSLVLGASPAIVERVLPFVTVFSKSADIDALVAPPEVVAALPGMTPQALNDFLKQRPSLPRDPKAIAAALGPAGEAAATLPDNKTYRVQTVLRFESGRRTVSEAVILLTGAGDKNGTTSVQSAAKQDGKGPYSILFWRDQVEAIGPPLRRAGR